MLLNCVWCWRRLLRVPWTARRSNQSILKEITPEYWKDWCWSWQSNTLATWCKELPQWKRPWCWERLKAEEGDDRGWDGWLASPTGCTWIWGTCRSWWWKGKPGVLQSRGSWFNWAELRVGWLHENSFPMNQFREESNKTSSLQMGTPTKLACPVKKSPDWGEKNVPDVYTGATYPPEPSPQALNREGPEQTNGLSWPWGRADLPYRAWP